jgi:hypothetical protein
VEHLKGSSLRQVLALLVSIRLIWKGLPRPNTVAYYEYTYITVVKCFDNIGPKFNIQRHFLLVNDALDNKLECLLLKKILILV